MSLDTVQQVREAAARLRSSVARKGLEATLLTLAGTLVRPLVRYQHHFIWEMSLDAPRSSSAWAHDERFSIIGPNTLDQEMNPRLRRFLGGDSAEHDIKGVQEGDRLLLVTLESAYVYSGYVYFNTTSATRRQKRIYCEPGDAPVIGSCLSTPAKIWGGPASQLPLETELARKVMQLLPAGTSLESATKDFKSLGQFVYTAQLAHNLEIPFEQLKALVVGGASLWQAIQVLKPEVDAMAEVRRAWDEASIHRRVLNDVFCYLKQLGYNRAINDVMARNDASHKANQAVGMKICRELRDWIIFGHLVVQRITETGRSRWRILLT